MTDRSYLSIGDVLAMLSDEFPDITISKIRFLESRGLLDPERTPSGYRKFYEADVERLRWILRQQRENFLPLKVIKGRLEGDPSVETSDTPSLFDTGRTPAPAPTVALVGAMAARGGEEGSPSTALGRSWDPDEVDSGMADWNGPRAEASPPRAGRSRRPAVEPLETGATAAKRQPKQGSAQGSASGGRGARGGVRTGGRRSSGQDSEIEAEDEFSEAAVSEIELVREPGASVGDDQAGLAEQPAAEYGSGDADAADEDRDAKAPAGSRGVSRALLPPSAPPAAPSGAAARATRARSRAARSLASGVSLTPAELAEASGLTIEDIERLEEYGLVSGRTVAGVRCYDEEGLVIARLAAAFARFGVEPRHLRTFKHAADREAGLFEQVVIPLLRQRNPEARAKATEALTELTELGAHLQAALLGVALRDVTG